MSAAAVIDSLEFARSEGQLRGSLAVVSLQRLDDVVFDMQGRLDYELRGMRDARNRPQIEVRVTGLLHLQCQRCLGLLDYELDAANTLLVVPGGERSENVMEDPESPDMIEANPELDVAGLIEDEVLLSLPLAPRHLEGTCQSRLDKHEDAAQAPSAFAQLAALKRPRGRNQRKS